MKGTDKLKEHTGTKVLRFDSHRGLCQLEENKYM